MAISQGGGTLWEFWVKQGLSVTEPRLLVFVTVQSASYGSNGHAQSDTQLIGEVTWLLLFQASFKLFSL